LKMVFRESGRSAEGGKRDQYAWNSPKIVMISCEKRKRSCKNMGETHNNLVDNNRLFG
jgi:hypothetical protein